VLALLRAGARQGHEHRRPAGRRRYDHVGADGDGVGHVRVRHPDGARLQHGEPLALQHEARLDLARDDRDRQGHDHQGNEQAREREARAVLAGRRVAGHREADGGEQAEHEPLRDLPAGEPGRPDELAEAERPDPERATHAVGRGVVRHLEHERRRQARAGAPERERDAARRRRRRGARHLARVDPLRQGPGAHDDPAVPDPHLGVARRPSHAQQGGPEEHRRAQQRGGRPRRRRRRHHQPEQHERERERRGQEAHPARAPGVAHARSNRHRLMMSARADAASVGYASLAMRPPKYALEPLARLRDRKVDEAAGALAGAVGEREAAEAERTRADRARAGHEHAIRGARAAEQQALERGELTVADLVRADAWEIRVAAERAAHDASLTRARQVEARAQAKERGAREQVASRRADAKVVASDRARWQEEQRKRAEARDEEAAAEGRRPKR